VLVIGIDGVRPDALLRAKAPTLRRLAREGQVDWDAQVVDTTLSGPSWAGFLTGVGVGRHGVRNNRFDGHRLAEVKTFFERVREVYPNDHLASIVAWQPFHSVLLANRRLGANMWRKEDDSVIDLAVYQLKKRDPRVLLVHLDAVDKAGHDYGYGPGAGHYRAAIEATDVRVGRLLAGLKARQKRLAEDWLVLVTTDHGGTGHGHGGGTPTDRRIFIIARGLGEAQTPFPKGSATLFDIAPTVLAYLGVPESSWASLDGRPLQLPLPAGVRPAVAAGEAGTSAPASELP
jgi:arylsulfatase A-like enzyme